MTGSGNVQMTQSNLFQHLQAALEADEADEKNYHIRQALQLLGIRDIEE